MNVDDGTQIWGNQYNRAASDLLAVQDEIAGEILDKLRPRLSGEDKKRATKRLHRQRRGVSAVSAGPLSLEQGHDRRLQAGRSSTSSRRSRQDPKYALAYAGLADSHLLLGSYWVESMTEAKSRRRAGAADRPEPGRGARRARAHQAAGSTGTGRRPSASSSRASRSTRRRRWRTTSTRCTSRRSAGVPDAIAEVQPRAGTRSALAHRQQPTSAGICSTPGSRPTRSRSSARRSSSTPTRSRRIAGSASRYSEDGRHDEAIAELQARAAALGEQPGRHGPPRRGVRPAQATRPTPTPSLQRAAGAGRARVRAVVGARRWSTRRWATSARALDWLEKAYDEHDFSMAQIGVAPWFKSLRNEPRFQRCWNDSDCRSSSRRT